MHAQASSNGSSAPRAAALHGGIRWLISRACLATIVFLFLPLGGAQTPNTLSARSALLAGPLAAVRRPT